MPGKIAELTKLHDAWLTGMANLVRTGAEHHGLTAPEGSAPKKKNRKKIIE